MRISQRIDRRTALCLLGLLCLSLAPDALALDPERAVDEYVRDGWEMQHGLPQSSVMAVLQTRDGYLWFGTHDGVARFDGVTFARFLEHHRVHALLEDRHGDLWIGTWGQGLKRYRDGRFTSFTTRDGLLSDDVRCLYEARDGTLWIGTNGGLAAFKDGVFSGYTIADGLAHPIVRAVLEDRHGVLWIGSHGGGLSSLQDGRLVHHEAPGLRRDEVVRAIYATSDGRLWLATAHGLKHVEARGGRASIVVESYGRAEGLSHDNLMTLHEDRDHQLWIGTQSGLCRLHQGRFGKSRAAGGLADAEVRSLFEDREGSLWVGTYAAGVSRLKERAFLSFTRNDGLSEDIVTTVHEDRQGALWIGTHNSGVNRVKDGRVTVFSADHGLPSSRVWSVTEDAAGTLWVGTFGGGIARYEGGRFKAVSVRDGLPSNIVRCLVGARDGGLWIGTEQGFARLHGDRVQRFGVADGLSHPDVLSILEGIDGTLWIGTRQGLNRLRGGVLDVPPGSSGLGGVFAMHEDSDGTLWLGTSRHGLWRFADGGFRAYTTAAGILDNTVLQILDDRRGHLWLSSPRGIFRVARSELVRTSPHAREVVLYGRADGMDSIECNGGFQPAGARTRDGRLWFPTMKGMAVIDARRTLVNTVRPPVHIESVRVGGRSLPLDALRVAPGSKSLEISYIGLSFVAAEKVRFRYKLEGLDEEWVEAGTRRTAYYTTLPPGRYRFRVNACNNSGYWSDSEAAVALTVLPWFYQTAWFYTLAAVAGVLLFVTEHTLRMRRTRARFAAVLEERTRIARELHDTLAQGLAVVGLQLDAAAVHLPARPGVAVRHHLDQARRQVRASLIEAKRSVWDLRSPRVDEPDLCGALEALVQDVAGTGSLDARFNADGRAAVLPQAVKVHLLRIAQEALSNTLKHARARRVDVTLSRGQGAVRLKVTDDGGGFDPQAIVTEGRFGLAGMRERARLLKAELTIARRPEGGTEISVCLPLDRGKERHRWRPFRTNVTGAAP